MITPQILAVVLLAFLIGAAIPVLYQLYQFLRRARALLDTAGPRLEKALDQAGQAADRLNGIGSTLEVQARALRPLFEAASRLGHLVDRSGNWLGTAMTVGGAVGPAVLAGVRAFFLGTDDRLTADGHPVQRSNKGNGPDGQQPRLTPSA